VLITGKVVGVHVGSILKSTGPAPAWEDATIGPDGLKMQEVSQVVPIQWVQRLAREKLLSSTEKESFYINGQKIGELDTDEFVAEIMHLREGRVVKRIPPYPFLDFKHLERFLEIEPYDTVIIRVIKGDSHSLRRIARWYEWNAHTQTVMQHSSRY
jgi:hypothetical protein